MARPKGLCKDCFPDGWDGDAIKDFSGVGCEHGTWTRPGEGQKADDDKGDGAGDGE